MKVNTTEQSETKKETLGLREKTLIFIDDHATELMAGAVTIGVISLAIIGKKIVNIDNSENWMSAAEKELMHNWNNGGRNKFLTSDIDNRYVLNLEQIPMCDLGNIGDEFAKAMPEVDPGVTPVNVVAYVLTGDEKKL